MSAAKISTAQDVIIIGAGPAGLAAAISARENGASSVLVIDRENEAGGILQQCVHNGFGLETFKEDFPGPAYAQRYIDRAVDAGVTFLFDTMVTSVSRDFRVETSNDRDGIRTYQGKAIVFAMGCRERSRAQIRIPGTRPAGVYTAGTAQRWVNIDGKLPGKRFVILGSGDIGMIMARRLTLEGAKVECVVEINSFLSGLSRNLVQCLQDYEIPLLLQHTVTRIIGERRVEGVAICQVDARWNPIPETERVVPCDALLLSVGLTPENELTRRAGVEISPLVGGPVVDDRYATNIPGFFGAGNVVQVYDLVDSVSAAAVVAGRSAAQFAAGTYQSGRGRLAVQTGLNVRQVVPQWISPESLKETDHITLQLRVVRPLEEPVELRLMAGERPIAKKRLPYARPGEMDSLPLTMADFGALQEVMMEAKEAADGLRLDAVLLSEEKKG